MRLVWVLVFVFLNNGCFLDGVGTNISRRPDFVSIGSIVTFDSVIGKVAKVAIEAAVEDVNSNPVVIGGTKLQLTMLNANYSGFLAIVEGNTLAHLLFVHLHLHVSSLDM